MNFSIYWLSLNKVLECRYLKLQEYKMKSLFLAFTMATGVIFVTTQPNSTTTTSTTIDDPYIPPNKTDSANHTAMMQEFVKVFSGNDEEKKNILMSNSTTIPETNDCYVDVFKAFKSHCLYYYYQLKTVGAFKVFFRQLCGTQWYQAKTINGMIKKTCAEKPYLKH